MNILLIEDNPSHLKLAHQVLSAAGHDVDDAGAAEEAIERVKAEKPQIILLDLALPGMDGLAFVRTLKTDPETRDIPVVAVTAYSERFSKSEMMAAGCAAYIVKPINTRTLPSELEQLMT